MVGLDGSLSCDPDLTAKVYLPRREVVVTVDALLFSDAVDEALDVRQGGVHHHLAVDVGVALRPLHHFDVALEGRPSEPREIPVFQGLGALLLGSPDEDVGDPVADAPGARVQHEPDPLHRVETDLDEVVTRSQGAELPYSSTDVEPFRVRDRVVAKPLGGPVRLGAARASPAPPVLPSHSRRYGALEQPHQGR